jgi:uncharacterized protein (DUF362 family)
MSDVQQEFEKQLAIWRELYPNNPKQEMLEICLLALEREEIVAVAYRESLMKWRIDQLAVPDDIKALFRHALLWIWKDEEMHTIYVRGVLLKLGGFSLKVKTIIQQCSGAIGGWSASVRQHLRWRDAPISLFFATIITIIGILAAKIPRAVRKEMNYASFKHFCEFNIEAEYTAAMAWERMTELITQHPEGFHELTDDIAHMARDEHNHREVFRIFGELLNENDEFVHGTSTAEIRRRLANISPFFLSPTERITRAGETDPGSGGKVYVQESQKTQDKITRFKAFLKECDLKAVFERKKQELDKPIDEYTVAIKANFMLAYNKKDPSPFLDPELLLALVDEIRSYGCQSVFVLEAPNIYDRFFQNRSVTDLAQYLGIASEHFQLIDASKDQVDHNYSRGMVEQSISKHWKDADIRLSFCKLRSHPIDQVYLSLGNLEGLGTRNDRYLFVERQAQRHTPVMMILEDFPADFSLVDAYEDIPDGLVGIMGAKKTRSPRRFYAGVDALTVDLTVAEHIGAPNIASESPLFQAAVQWYGNPQQRTEIIGPSSLIRPWKGPYSGGLSSFLAMLSYPVYQFGSQRGKLFVASMDNKAFPGIKPPSLLCRAARFFTQFLLGLPRFS